MMTTAQPMFKISIQPQRLFSSAESLILVRQERSDAETAQRVISQTFIYWPCAAPCQQSQYLYLHNFILYVTAVSGRIYIWSKNFWIFSLSLSLPCASFFSFTFVPTVQEGAFSVPKRHYLCTKHDPKRNGLLSLVTGLQEANNLTSLHKNLGTIFIFRIKSTTILLKNIL